MKIVYEPKKCIGCGICASTSPAHFKMNKDNKAELIKGKKVKDNCELEIKEETQEINGGELGPWLKKAGLVGLAYDVIDNWSTIKKGFLAGWNSLK